MSAWLIDTVLYTGALIALVLVLRRPVGRFFGAQLAYGLWALPFLRLLLPPVVLPASFAPEPAPAVPVVEAGPVFVEMPAETAAAAVTAAAPAPAMSFVAAPEPAWQWTDLIAPAASLWAGVALAFLAWRVVTYRRMRRELLKGARPVGEIGRIRLVETPALAAPVAFGVFDRVIALPPLFMAQPDIAARDLAIAHELAHHKGHDLLANFAAQALLALHWFNPLAWYGWRAMRRDQEAACDARVLAGRGREERLRYAALIAGVATGPRPLLIDGALAAPMACPVLGERSIVHRLRSLSMSETSRRRRWFGRGLVGASALALPLTASISYAAATAQPAPPAPPAAELQPVQPVQPVPPAAQAEDGERHVQTFVLNRTGRDGRPIVQEFAWHGPQPPRVEWPQGEWDSEEFQRSMEQFQREMEQFREQFAEQHGQAWEQWAEQYGKQWEQWGERYADSQEHRAERLAEAQQHRAEAQARRAEALAQAQQARSQAWAAAVPEVVVNCDENVPARSSVTADGRQQIVICDEVMNRFARSSLRNARESIARNPEISEEVRREVLEDLDQEIARIERDEG